jgi:hypothetical protein
VETHCVSHVLRMISPNEKEETTVTE